MPEEETKTQLAILVIDDDPLIIRMFRRFFTRVGFRVETASNGQEGLQLIKTAHPDLVLLDLKLPVLDGFEVLRRMREDAATTNIPVVCFSGFADKPGIKNECLRLGALDVIMKGSMPPDNVVKRVLQLLGKPDALASNFVSSTP